MKLNVYSAFVRHLLFYAGATIFITSCYSDAKKKIDEPEKFQIINPVILDTVYTTEYVAEIQSVQNVEIRSRIKGFIEKIFVDEGKEVRSGQVLFRLSDKEFREDLLQANAQLKSSIAELKSVEVQMKSTQRLVDKNIISRSELEIAQAKREALDAKIDELKSAISVAQLNLSFTEVRAPFNGVINRIPNKTGSLVEEGALLTTISDNREVYAYFNVSESEYLRFINQKKLGKPQEVSLQLADGQIFNHKGTVETVESEFNKSTGNLAFRAKFPNPDHVLKHGATAKILMNSELKNAMVIPQKSTFDIQENAYVYVMRNDSTVEMRKIVPTIRLPYLFVVSSGLTVHDNIIYEGIQRIKEGDKIKPEKISFAQITNL